jgi:hypothetical protein
MRLTAADVLGWMAIGAAASLAGMIWPFRRGVLGVVVNLCAGVGGAVMAALLSYLLVPPPRGAGMTRLFFAAAGAIASLGLAHAIWIRRVPHLQSRSRRGSGPTAPPQPSP